MAGTSLPSLNAATRRDVVKYIIEYRLVRQPRLFARFLTTLAASGRGSINEKSRRTARDVIFFLAECYFRGEEASITDVYLAAEVAKTTAIRCVDLLAKLGIVKRTQDGRDRRRASIVLAEPYCAILEHFVAEAFEDFKEVIETRAAVQLRLAKDALKESEERYRDFAEAGCDWLWETDLEARVTWISEGCRHLTGDPDEMFIGRPLDGIVGPEAYDADAFQSWKERVRRRLRFHDVPVTRMSRAGKLLRLRISGKPYFDSDGRFLGYRGATRNVTAQREAEDRTIRSERLLLDAIDAVSDALALYDSDDRLVVCNKEYRMNHPVIERLAQRGIAFETLFRAKVKAGLFLDAIGREETFIQERFRHHANPGETFVMRGAHGRTRQCREQRLADGSMLFVGISIGEIKAAEARAEADRKRLTEAVEAIADGLALYDANDRLVLFNSHFRDHLAPVVKRLKPGLKFSDITVALVDAGFYAGVEDREAFLTRRLEAHRQAKGMVLHEKFEDRWIDVAEYRTSDGGTLLIRHDITERRKAELSLECMAAAIDVIYEYFLVYDADERLILANQRARDLNASCSEAVEPGITFEARQRFLIAAGMLPEAAGHEDAFIEERLLRFRNPGESFTIRWKGGVAVTVREQKLPDGGTVTVARRAGDVTIPASDSLATGESGSRIAFSPVRATAERSARKTVAAVPRRPIGRRPKENKPET